LVTGVVFSPDGKRIASYGSEGAVRVWDTTTGKEIFTLRARLWRRFSNVVFSPDGRRLATAVGNQVQVWDAATGREVVSFQGHAHTITNVAFSPDGKRLACAAGMQVDRRGRPLPGEVKVRDAASGKEILTLRGIDCGSFSPDGRRLATIDVDRVRVWDVTTGQEVLSVE